MSRAAALLGGVILVAGCASAPDGGSGTAPAAREEKARTGSSDAVALVDGEAITAEEVAAQAAAAHSDARAALEALVDARVLAREAERRGLDRDPSVREAAEREMVRRFLSLGFEREVTPRAVTEADIQRAYEKNSNQFDHPEIQVVLHILAPASASDPQEKREAALRRAQQVAERARTIRDEAAFRALVPALSDDKVTLKGEEVATGRVGWTVKPFADAAFALAQPGDTSGVVETRFGYHVLFLKRKIPAVHIPIDQVRETLQNGMWPEVQRREFGRLVDQLVDKHHIEVFAGRLDPAEGEPGAAP